jgi:ferredoxin
VELEFCHGYLGGQILRPYNNRKWKFCGPSANTVLNLPPQALPGEAIHPLPGEADFEAVDQLNINMGVCMDCGACALICPTGAIFPAGRLPKGKADAAKVNCLHFLPD